MNLDRLTAQLELTTRFSDRQTLAKEMAQELDRGELARIARLLGHESTNVRLGVIEVLREAKFRPALQFLAAVTLQRSGDERAFAARAVTELVHPDNPEDRKLAQPLCARWRAAGDEFLAIHADALARLLESSSDAEDKNLSLVTNPTEHAGTLETVAATAASARPIEGIIASDAGVRRQAIARTAAHLEHPEREFADALLSTRHKGARLDLVHALERLGAPAMSRVLDDILRQGNGDLTALVLRALRRSAHTLSAERKALVCGQILASRPRFLDHELARAAMEDCLVAIQTDGDLGDSVTSADRIAPEAAFHLGRRLCAMPERERLEHLQTLISALERAPRRALLFAELLEWAWPYFRPSRRDQVHEILLLAEAKKFPDALPPSAVAAIGRLYALALRPGDPMPHNLLHTLEQHHDHETALATISLYRALATEEAVTRLNEYLTNIDAKVRDAARDALAQLDSRG